VPSRYGLITGRHPFRPGGPNGGGKGALVKPGQATLASVLHERGYRTAMIGKWHLGFDRKDYERGGVLRDGPFHRGFDSFFGLHASTDIAPYFFIRDDRIEAAPTDRLAERRSPGWTDIQGEFWRGGGIAPGMQLKDVLPRLADESVALIHSHAQAASAPPLFLYLALTAPHTPWLPAPEFAGSTQAEMYGDFVRMTDAMIGRVLAALDETKLADNTLVLFTSDNGPVWYPEDVKRAGHDANGGLRGMKNSNWEAGHRVPFIVRWPGRVKAGAVSDQLVCFTDVMATFAELTGATLADDAGPDSFSFLPALLGTPAKSAPLRESLVIGQSVRLGPWKWIEGREPVRFGERSAGVYPPESEPPGQLYHLGDDPGETTNLAAKHPEMVAKLKAEFTRVKQATRTRP
jgi:arylsulfatase A-like enzyme